jgi:hypothetical protein
VHLTGVLLGIVGGLIGYTFFLIWGAVIGGLIGIVTYVLGAGTLKKMDSHRRT